jgi:hypothetical protein
LLFVLFCCAEGVLQAEKDYNLEKHPEIDVPNLHVIKLMQSFKSKEFVKERFAWRHYYWWAVQQAGSSKHGQHKSQRHKL